MGYHVTVKFIICKQAWLTTIRLLYCTVLCMDMYNIHVTCAGQMGMLTEMLR